MAPRVMQDGLIVLANSASDRQTWLEARQPLVTASDVAAVLGLHPHKSRNQLLAQKRVGERDLGNIPAVRAGRFLEQGVFDWFLADMQMISAGAHGSIWGDLLQSPVCPRLGATPDAWITSGDDTAIVEVKMHGAKASDSWGPKQYREPRAWNKLFPGTILPCWGEVPIHHWCQLQTQMHCAKLTQGFVVGCLCGTRRVDYMYPYAPWFLERVFEEVETFWSEV